MDENLRKIMKEEFVRGYDNGHKAGFAFAYERFCESFGIKFDETQCLYIDPDGEKCLLAGDNYLCSRVLSCPSRVAYDEVQTIELV